MNFVGKNLLIPVVVGAVAFYWSNLSQRTSIEIANRQKLADAYVEFGKAAVDLNKAHSGVQVLISHGDSSVKASEVDKLVVDYHSVMSGLGAKFAPFEEFARRTNFYGPIVSGVSTPLQETWDRCYIIPYYGTSAAFPAEKSYWGQIRAMLNKCAGDACPAAAVQQITKLMWYTYSGTCLCGKPAQQRPFIWFWNEMRSIMLEQKLESFKQTPSEMGAAPPNADLLAPANKSCESG